MWLSVKNFNPDSIKVSADAVSEMERLCTKSVPAEPIPQVVALPRESWMKIGHRNVHSYLAKKEDIMKDQTISCANIMCFTETFLKPDQQITDDIIPLREECAVFRLDRLQTNSEDLAKGGIMIICPLSLLPNNTNISCPAQLEAMSITVTSTHSSCRMCIVAVYRRPQQNMAAFLTLFSNYLTMLPQIMPIIILGDFNEDLLSTGSSSRLLALMSSRRFLQLVKLPTIDSGSLLDIYYNGTIVDTSFVDVVDTYYSDHDAVYLSLPI